MPLLTGTLTHFANPNAHSNTDYSAEQHAILSVVGADQAICDITQWPGYAVTPLHSLNDIALSTGLEKLWYKDESQRFGLKSFKALGGAYAVARQLQAVLAVRYGKPPRLRIYWLVSGNLKLLKLW